QAAPNKFLTFRSPPAPSGGFLLQGFFHLYLDQDRPGDVRFTALLLDCAPDPPEPPASTGCTQIAIASADQYFGQGENGNGTKDRVAHFGSVNHTIPQGRELRIKVVNQRENPPGLVVSTDDPIKISYGFLPARPSRLERTATP
ncbi:MAG TPA: hypothetical protein VJ804_09810, partial [Acidimicrobiales bacterium]|nr:hypothetical protein [Acidimicrobiales bacterium]